MSESIHEPELSLEERLQRFIELWAGGVISQLLAQSNDRMDSAQVCSDDCGDEPAGS